MTDFLMTDGSCPWIYLKEMCDGGAIPKEVFNLLKAEFDASETALQIVKDENEVNKKNMFKFIKETKQQSVIIANEVARREKAEQENETLKKKLKDEIDDNHTVLEQVREYLERFGGDEVDVFDSICNGDTVIQDGEEEEMISYEDEDDWDRAYGYKIKNGDYIIHIQGGCEDWIDYVINRKGCFVRNMYGDKKVFAFVSCPDANYVKVWKTPHDHGGLKLREGEQDMFEMIKDCFSEEIINYETDEEDECFPGR